MIIDKFVTFTGSTTATGTATGNSDNTDSPTTGTQVSSQVVDLHMAGIPVLAASQGARDVGIGDDPAMKILAEVTVAFASGTSLAVNCQGAPDDGTGAAGTYNTLNAGAVVAEANLIVGARLLDKDIGRPDPGNPFARFLRLQYVTVGTHTAGKLWGSLVLDRMDQPLQSNAVMGAYPAGITVAN